MEESQKDNVQPEQKQNSGMQPIELPSSPAIANTFVVCSQSPTNKKWSEEDIKLGQQMGQLQKDLINFYETQLDDLHKEMYSLLEANKDNVLNFLVEARERYDMRVSVKLHKEKDTMVFGFNYDEAKRFIERQKECQTL